MRMGRDEYFMNITEDVCERSTCLKRNYGAILVKNNRILATGYNGAPKGLDHCEVCARENAEPGKGYNKCRGVHAEQNAIIQAAVSGVNISGSTLYVNGFPCVQCTRMLINSEINKIVYKHKVKRPSDMAVQLLEESNIDVIKYE